MTLRRRARAVLPQTRTLILDLAEPELRALRTSEARVALARASHRVPPNAVWLAWAPQAVTTVVWTQTYGIFAAAIPQRDGAPIGVVASAQPAVERAVHPFLGHEFAPPVANPDLPRRHYEIRNASPSAAAFGLLQAATIDDSAVVAPLNAVVLPPGFSADFTDFDTVYVWLQADVFGGTAMVRIPQAATAIVYAPRERVKRYRYDPRTSLFVPLPGRR